MRRTGVDSRTTIGALVGGGHLLPGRLEHRLPLDERRNRFHQAELERLAPGQILWQSYDIEHEAYVKHTSDSADFGAHACDDR